MSKLPQISAKGYIKTLKKFGFYKKCQKGNHIILCRDAPFTEVVVSNHNLISSGQLPPPRITNTSSEIIVSFTNSVVLLYDLG